MGVLAAESDEFGDVLDGAMMLGHLDVHLDRASNANAEFEEE